VTGRLTTAEGEGLERLRRVKHGILFLRLGIELGPLAFVAALLLVAAALRKIPVAWPRWAKTVPAYGIGTMATFWFLQRALSLV